MKKIIVYKTADNTIESCAPGEKVEFQKSLDRTKDRESYIAAAERSAQFEVSIGHSRRTLDNKIAWARSVKDFKNVTDTEFHDFILAVDVPENKQYAHWIDKGKVSTNDFFRDSWVDIDADGKVSYDLVKAKKMLASIISVKIKKNRDEVQALLDKGGVAGDADVSAINNKQSLLQSEVTKIKNLSVTKITDLTPSISLLEA